MSKVKGQGNTRNNRKSAGKRLGVKRYAGTSVRKGEVLVRQVGQNKLAGNGTYLSRNFTIHAAHDGVVEYAPRRIRSFTGRSKPRTEVRVIANA